jgi:hypothetical protein
MVLSYHYEFLVSSAHQKSHQMGMGGYRHCNYYQHGVCLLIRHWWINCIATKVCMFEQPATERPPLDLPALQAKRDEEVARLATMKQQHHFLKGAYGHDGTDLPPQDKLALESDIENLEANISDLETDIASIEAQIYWLQKRT